MGRTRDYLADECRIQRRQRVKDAGVVSTTHRAPWGDWIPCRLRPVTGTENRLPGQVKLVYSHELVVAAFDNSGNETCPQQDDEFEIRVSRNDEISDSLLHFKITGAILEVRKRSTIQSYVIQVTLEDEF